MSGGRVHGKSENNTNVVAKTPILSLAFVCGRLLAVVSGERGRRYLVCIVRVSSNCKFHFLSAHKHLLCGERIRVTAEQVNPEQTTH